MNPLRKGFSGTLWLLIAATAVRLLFSLAVHPPGHFVFSDMLTNYDHSRRLRGFHFNPWDTFNPIGYPVLLALIDPTGRHFWTVAVVQSLLGGILCLLAALISEKISNSRHVATAVFVATAFYFPHIYYCGFILTEIPSAFFFTFYFWLLLGVQGPDDRIRLAGAGLSLSAASIVRPNMLLIFAAVPFYLWLAFRRDPKAAGKALRPFFLAAL